MRCWEYQLLSEVVVELSASLERAETDVEASVFAYHGCLAMFYIFPCIQYICALLLVFNTVSASSLNVFPQKTLFR